MNKHLGQNFNEHLNEILKYDDVAVYYYIKEVDPTNAVALAIAINDVVNARKGKDEILN